MLEFWIPVFQSVRECKNFNPAHSRESGNPVILVISITYLDSRFHGNEEQECFSCLVSILGQTGSPE